MCLFVDDVDAPGNTWECIKDDPKNSSEGEVFAIEAWPSWKFV